NQFDLPKTQSLEFIDTVFENIIQALASEDESVRILGFGNFEKIRKNPRPGLNPKTREKHTVSARDVVVFRAKQSLKKLLKG
ncbi:MAG: HU family DNA-binding protein, partial [Gammaproteobacteria bacterium]